MEGDTMEIRGIGNDITNAYQGINESEQKATDFQKIIDQAIKEKDDQELKKACEEFEAYYVQQLFKEMRKTVPDGGMFEKSNEKDIYTDMLDTEYSSVVSKGSGTGIADVLYKQLSPKIHTKENEEK